MTDSTLTLDPQRTAVLVLDCQPGIISRLPEPDVFLDRVAAVVAGARSAGARVGYVRVAFEDADFDAIPAHSSFAGAATAQARQHYHADAPTTAVHDRLAPEPGDIVVRKTRIGAFSTTDLDQQLRTQGVDTLVLTGISTSGVVLSTVRDAADRDFRVLVVSDATTDPDAEMHAFLTTRFFPRQATVLTAAELAATLR